jgi:hypothetical protein
VRFYSSLDIAKTGYKLLRTLWVWEITGLLPWPLLSSYTSLIQVLSRLSLEIVKFYFSRWTSFPGNSAEIWHKVLIPLCRWFIENPRGSLAPFSIGFESPFRWLTENPRGSLAPFGIGFDSPPSWWLTRNPRGLFDPFGIGLDPPFWKVYWTPKWPFWPLFFGFIILPVIQFTGLYLI